jgi:hypothetical protein
MVCDFLVVTTQRFLLIARVLRRTKQRLQRCRLFQCDDWAMGHRPTQRSSILPCSHISSQSRMGCVRRRLDRPRFLTDFVLFLSLYLAARYSRGFDMFAFEEEDALENMMLTIFTGEGIQPSIAVDIFDAKSGRWSTAALSVARGGVGATSLPDQGLVITAGGGQGVFSCWNFQWICY